jgi:hydrogenase/urease accessory protein HupE
MVRSDEAMRNLRLFLICLVQLAGTPSLRAHDPGLSTVELEQGPTALRARMTFARADAALVPAALIGEPQRLLEVELGGRAAAAESVRVSGDDANVLVELEYPAPAPGGLVMRSLALGVLPRGHRQYVSLRDGSGRVVADRFLDTRSDRFQAVLERGGAVRSAPFRRFFLLGVEHILTGWDHLAFLVGLLLAATRPQAVLGIITSFTAAHSITLALGALGLVALSPRIVEPLIALSIVYVGLENILRRDLERRWRLTFAFGLAHGFGFASALADLHIGSGPDGIFLPLLSFNLGVESGQLAVAALLLPVVWRLRRRPAFAVRWAPACSVLVALAGGFWFLQRVAF